MNSDTPYESKHKHMFESDMSLRLAHKRYSGDTEAACHVLKLLIQLQISLGAGKFSGCGPRMTDK